MAKNPYMKFFVGDWIRDTRMCTLEEKGVWVDLLTFMHSNDECGFIEGTWEDISRLIGANDAAKCKQVVSSLAAKRICDLQANVKQEFGNVEFATIINRRMFQAFELSKKRSKAGAKGGQKSAAGRNQNSSNSFFSNEANTKQNCGYGSGNGIVEEEKGGVGEKEETEEPAGKHVVPEMLSAYKQRKPRYIVQKEKDFPALLKIAELIAEQEGVSFLNESGLEKVLATWATFCEFIVADKFYSTFNLHQIEKYIQAIAVKIADAAENGTVKAGPVPQKSIIGQNHDAAQQAKSILRKQTVES